MYHLWEELISGYQGVLINIFQLLINEDLAYFTLNDEVSVVV